MYGVHGMRSIPAAALSVMLVWACGASEGAPLDDEEVGRQVNVEVTPITLGEFADYVRVTGEVQALHDVVVSAEEGGTIARFLVSRGARVSAGQVIAELDDAVLRAQVDEARAAAELARVQYERQRVLWEEERIGSEIAFLTARSQAEVAQARQQMLEARLARTRIRAPVAGIFDDKFMEAGEMAMPGQRVARVVATRQVKVAAGIPERFAPNLRTGDSATVTFDVLPGRELTGRIGFVGASVDPVNRTVPIEVIFDNPGGVLRPQMIANVRVVRERLDGVIVVPQESVMRTETGYEAFVVVERDGRRRAESRPVVLGPSYRNRVVITEGLVPGDLLITVGHQLVDPGTPVRVIGDSAPVVREATR